MSDNTVVKRSDKTMMKRIKGWCSKLKDRFISLIEKNEPEIPKMVISGPMNVVHRCGSTVIDPKTMQPIMVNDVDDTMAGNTMTGDDMRDYHGNKDISDQTRIFSEK